MLTVLGSKLIFLLRWVKISQYWPDMYEVQLDMYFYSLSAKKSWFWGDFPFKLQPSESTEQAEQVY